MTDWRIRKPFDTIRPLVSTELCGVARPLRGGADFYVTASRNRRASPVALVSASSRQNKKRPRVFTRNAKSCSMRVVVRSVRRPHKMRSLVRCASLSDFRCGAASFLNKNDLDTTIEIRHASDITFASIGRPVSIQRIPDSSRFAISGPGQGWSEPARGIASWHPGCARVSSNLLLVRCF